MRESCLAVTATWAVGLYTAANTAWMPGEGAKFFGGENGSFMLLRDWLGKRVGSSVMVPLLTRNGGGISCCSFLAWGGDWLDGFHSWPTVAFGHGRHESGTEFHFSQVCKVEQGMRLCSVFSFCSLLTSGAEWRRGANLSTYLGRFIQCQCIAFPRGFTLLLPQEIERYLVV